VRTDKDAYGKYGRRYQASEKTIQSGAERINPREISTCKYKEDMLISSHFRKEWLKINTHATESLDALCEVNP
jgi:hypothetical protein